MSDTGRIKLFVSHASEDKASFVEPLVGALKDSGFEVWYDVDNLHSTESLLEGIGKGLNWCDYGVVVFSKVYFCKKWTMGEVDGLYALETSSRKLIIQVWLDVEVADVVKVFPMLAGRKAISGKLGIPNIVNAILDDVQLAKRVKSLSPIEEMKAGLLGLIREQGAVEYDRRERRTERGVTITLNAMKDLTSLIVPVVEDFATVQQDWKVTQSLIRFPNAQLVFTGAYGITAYLALQGMAINGLSGYAGLKIQLFQDVDGRTAEVYNESYEIFLVSENSVEWSLGKERHNNASLAHWLIGKVFMLVTEAAPKRK